MNNTITKFEGEEKEVYEVLVKTYDTLRPITFSGERVLGIKFRELTKLMTEFQLEVFEKGVNRAKHETTQQVL